MQTISAVVPVLNEVSRLPELLAGLFQVVSEIIVVDGGSKDGSDELATELGARVVHASGGRGPQLRRGVEATSGDVIWVVHADASLPKDPVLAMTGPLQRGNAGAFSLRIQHPSFRYRIVEFGVWLRNRLTGIPYGDHGVYFTRELYDRVGGFEAIPIMEDIAFAQAVRRHGRKIEIVRPQIGTDARRWERDGVFRRTIKNWNLAIRFQLLGADPQVLANYYKPESHHEE